jgi:hypothetical protein
MKKILLLCTIFTSLQGFSCENVRNFALEKLGESTLEMFRYKEYFEKVFTNDNDRYWYLAGRAEALLEVLHQLETDQIIDKN